VRRNPRKDFGGEFGEIEWGEKEHPPENENSSGIGRRQRSADEARHSKDHLLLFFLKSELSDCVQIPL